MIFVFAIYNAGHPALRMWTSAALDHGMRVVGARRSLLRRGPTHIAQLAALLRNRVAARSDRVIGPDALFGIVLGGGRSVEWSARLHGRAEGCKIAAGLPTLFVPLLVAR